LIKMLFLGTGSAWSVPEYGCDCVICRRMRELGERRSRSSIFLDGREKILIDCGPDIRDQMTRFQIPKMDAVLITHEHGDHYLGLDELLSFKRCAPRDQWRHIPVYATEETWKSVEARFGYLQGSLIEKRLAVPGTRLAGLETPIVPFGTDHGEFPKGSVGYAVFYGAENSKKLIYTSDFKSISGNDDLMLHADIVIMQANWFNEPEFNRPSHMSLQRGLEFLRKWAPRGAVYLIHLSDSDWVDGDPANRYLKKRPPLDPLKSPLTGRNYPIPTCQREWESVVNMIVHDYDLRYSIEVAYDGLTVPLD